MRTRYPRAAYLWYVLRECKLFILQFGWYRRIFTTPAPYWGEGRFFCYERGHAARKGIYNGEQENPLQNLS